MPDAPNHNHPDYEKTFSKVATILEQVAEALQAQAEQSKLQAEQSKLQAEQSKLQAEQAKRTRADLDAWIAHSKVRDAETTDKLNGLIDLMDRHIREHGGTVRD